MISVIIPAHNEEAYLDKCLNSIARSAQFLGEKVEIVIVLNRCTDNTEHIAKATDATIVHEDARNLAKIRNAGVAASSGDITITIDADSIMSENMLFEIRKALSSGRYVGGGVSIRFERYSVGIHISYLFLRIYLWLKGLSGDLYWLKRDDFDAIGGFNENMPLGEDLDFAKRLKKFGSKNQRKFKVLPRVSITTSCRKFDRFGDWIFLKTIIFQQRKIKRSLQGKDNSWADKYFYDFNG